MTQRPRLLASAWPSPSQDDHLQSESADRSLLFHFLSFLSLYAYKIILKKKKLQGQHCGTASEATTCSTGITHGCQVMPVLLYL